MLGQHETHFNNWKAQGNHSGLSDSSDTIATKPMEPATDALTEGLNDATATLASTKKKEPIPFTNFTGGNWLLLCLHESTHQCPNAFEKVTGRLLPNAFCETDDDINLLLRLTPAKRKKVDNHLQSSVKTACDHCNIAMCD